MRPFGELGHFGDLRSSSLVRQSLAVHAEWARSEQRGERKARRQAVKKRIAQQAADGVPLSITAELSDESWHRIISVNLDGPFFMVRAALRHMLPVGAGTIIVVGLTSGIYGVNVITSSSHPPNQPDRRPRAVPSAPPKCCAACRPRVFTLLDALMRALPPSSPPTPAQRYARSNWTAARKKWAERSPRQWWQCHARA